MKEFLQKLVQQETTSEKGELPVAEIIAAEFAKSKIETSIDTWDKTRANITARVSSSGERKALLFLAHLDVVPPGEQPWTNQPFSGLEQDGKIHGRGAADMKGAIAACVTAIRQLVDSKQQLKGDIIFLGSAGEETDSCGTRRFLKNMPAIPELAGVIVIEPTDFDIVTEHNGMLWLEIETLGKTAHGSTPHLGVNAIELMMLLMRELDRYRTEELPKGSSMSVNAISGGKAANVVPDKCGITVDIRTIFGSRHSDIIADIEGIFGQLKRKKLDFEAKIRVLRDVGGLRTDGDCDFVKSFCDSVGIYEKTAVTYATDGSYFAKPGVPIVVFGPGKPVLCHKPDEYIELDDVKKGVEYYKEIIKKFVF